LFTDLTLELIFDLVNFVDDDLKGFKHCYGGKLITFTSVEAAKAFSSQLLVNVVVGKKTHCFTTKPTLVIFSDVHIHVMGLFYHFL